MKRINTFIFLDLEATGLGGDKPRITELSMIAIHRLFLLDSDTPFNLPRVLDKLTLCFYPMKQITPTAAAITGLYNDNLSYKKDFDSHMEHLLNHFLKRQDPPICLVAHNGKNYDFSLLQAELHALNICLLDSLLCLDSLEMFKDIDLKEEEQRFKEMQENVKRNQETPIKVFSSASIVNENDTSENLGMDRFKSVKRKLFIGDSLGENNKHSKLSEPLKKQDCSLSQTDLRNPQKQQSLLKTLACEEIISSDGSCSGTDETHQILSPSMSVQDSISDDVLLQYDLENTVQSFYKNEDQRDEVSNISDSHNAKESLLDASQSKTNELENKSLPDVTDRKTKAANKLQLALAKAAECSKFHSDENPCKLASISNDRDHKITPEDTNSTTGISMEQNKHKQLKISYKLCEIYHRLFNSYPPDSHTAEDDCVSLAKICMKNSKTMVEWADKNACNFNSIKPMYLVQRRTPLKDGVFPYQ